jgi:membrane protease YdiL (CAAX protease family)
MLSDSFNAQAAAAGGHGGRRGAARPPAVPPVPWNPWLGVAFLVAVYYASQIMAGVLVSVYPAARHLSHTEALDWISGSVWAQFVFVALAEAFAIGAVYLFLRLYKAGFRLIGLRRPRYSDVVYGVLAVPVYFLLYALAVGVVSYLVPGLNVDQKQQLGFDDVHGQLALVLTFISLVVLPPLAEEIMMRGFLYSTLRKAMPVIAAAIITSVLFAIAHLPEGGAAGPLYIAAIDTFVLSLVLVYLRERTGGLWASMTLHASKNCIAFVLLFVLHIK